MNFMKQSPRTSVPADELARTQGCRIGLPWFALVWLALMLVSNPPDLRAADTNAPAAAATPAPTPAPAPATPNPAPAAAPAPTPSPEEILFKAASQEFNTGLHEKAAKDFAEFVTTFPNSEKLPEALLNQGQALYRLHQYEPVIRTLESNLPRAGKIADKFRMLIADSYFQREEFAKAAEAYALVLKDYPDSFKRAEASYGEALAWYRLGNLANAIARIQPPDSAFQKIAQTQTNDEFVLCGQLLLAEIFLKQNQLPQAEEILKLVATREQPPQVTWKRQYLLARVQLEGNRAPEALQGVTNLVAAAKATGNPSQWADTILLQGAILQAASQVPAAIELFEQQRPQFPVGQQKQALLKLIAWRSQLGQWQPAIVNLEQFASQFPQDPAMDQIRLSLGELRLKQYQNFAPGALTNAAEIAAARATVLNQAQTNLDLLLTAFPKSPLIGQAQLYRGWCLWEAGKIADSGAAFQAAAQTLPASADQMSARFQYAQALFQQASDTHAVPFWTNAIANYWQLADQYGSWTNLPTALIEQSLYQIIRASDALGDAATAGRALERLLKNYPKSGYGDRSLMLAGQILERLEHPADARARYADLLKIFPASELAPEAKLALARSFAHEGSYDPALAEYDGWLHTYTNHPKWPDAQYDCAWANGQAGRETNAYAMFTNFLAKFPTHPKAPLARFWIGQNFFNNGKYQNAEENFQLLYQSTNYPDGIIKWQARLYAGESAFKRQAYKQASDYFKELIPILQNAQTTNYPAPLTATDKHDAPALLDMAWIRYGNTFRTEASIDITNALANFNAAIVAYSKVPTNSPFILDAWGLIADCYLQVGAQDPLSYTNAIANYTKVLEAPTANVRVRSVAMVGLAMVHERRAALPGANQADEMNQALDLYLDVAYGKKLKPNENADAFWVFKAGLEAGRLLGAKGQWAEAMHMYQYLLTILPPSAKETITQKLEYARKQAG